MGSIEREKSLISVEYRKEFNPTTFKVMESNTLKLDNTAIQKGLVKGLGYIEFTVLVIIASHCGAEGESFPSQRRIADLTGMSVATVNKAVNKLLDTKVGGVPILSRELVQLPKGRKMSIYTLGGSEGQNTGSQEDNKKDSEGVKQEYEVVKKMNSKDVAHYFKTAYENEFGIPYSLNYSKELGMVKTKLLKDYSQEQIVAIIDYAVSNYLTKWASPSYPYPTIPMLCSWLANTVMQQISGEQKVKEELESSYDDDKNEDIDYSNYKL